MSQLRKNSKLRAALGLGGAEFLHHVMESPARILPHISLSAWCEGPQKRSDATWASSRRRQIHMTIALGGDYGLSAEVSRKGKAGERLKTLDRTEKDLCERMTLACSSVLRTGSTTNDRSLKAIQSGFDEAVVAAHLQESFHLDLDVHQLFEQLHRLAEQTYENKSLTFGCIIDPSLTPEVPPAQFPKHYLVSKRFRALSDGLRTAYLVGPTGHLQSFIQLPSQPVKNKHWFPSWAEPLAFETLKREALGVALTRQGDILVFERGNLRFSYRFGRWQYWNHHHLVEVLKSVARRQKVAPKTIRQVVEALYRSALDVSFRRTGGLFVILRDRRRVGQLVRDTDQVGNSGRDSLSESFDGALEKRIQSLPRAVVADVAGIDGAIVVDGGGRILAYGAVLEPRRQAKTKFSEGARTKAALAASRLGIAVKVSADGGITVFANEEKVFEV